MSKIRELCGRCPLPFGAATASGLSEERFTERPPCLAGAAMVRGRPVRRLRMVLVAFDARDAHRPPLRGWGRYAAELERALPRIVELRAFRHGGPGPETVFEQARFARLAARAGADVLHAPNCFLPLRRTLPGVVTVHDLAFEAHPRDFARTTGAKYRFFTPRAVRSAERVICVSHVTADDVCGRYGADPRRIRVMLPRALAAARRRAGAGRRALPAGDRRRAPEEEPRPAGGGVARGGDRAPARRRRPRLVAVARRRGARLPRRRRARRAAARSRPARPPLAVRGLRPGGRGGDGARRARRVRGRDVAAGGRRRRRAAVRPARPRRDRGGDDARRWTAARSWSGCGRERVAELSWERTARETAAVYAELA